MRVPRYYLPAPLRIKETAEAAPEIAIDVAGIVRSIVLAAITIWGMSWGIPNLIKSFTGGTSSSSLQSSTASYATLFEVMMPLVMIIGIILLVVFLMRNLFSSQGEEAPPPPPTTEIIIAK